MASRLAHLRSEAGSTLVELLVTITVLAVGLLGVFVMIDTANSATRQSMGREGATTLAREVLERARQLSYASLTTRPAALGDQIRAVMPDASITRVDASTFSLTRRNQTAYTVAVTACKVDAPSDGPGVHTNAWCAPSCPDGTTDPSCKEPGGAVANGTSVQATLLGYPVALGGDVTALACGLLGTAPNPGVVNALLGRTGPSTLNGLLMGGADLRTCPVGSAGASGTGTVAVDPQPDDLTSVKAVVTWSGGRRSVSQSVLVPNA